MKNIKVILILMVFSAVGVAGEGDFLTTYEDVEIPEIVEMSQGGLPESPIIACPRPLKKYSDLLEQLNGIKTKIQSEACKNSNIEVDSLEKLVSEDRQTFVDLIKKGALGNGQLNAQEVETVQTYIKSIVTKAASIAGLVKNEACFDDTDKQSTLGFLSSVISEVSGAVGALTGPFGAKISLGGKLAGAMLESVDAIVQARQTYEYGDPKNITTESITNINNYVNNLCTYYDFKSDLDRERDLYATMERYIRLYHLTEDFLEMAEEKCEDCAVIIADYKARAAREEGFNVDDVKEVDADEATRGTDAEEVIPDSSVAFDVHDDSHVAAAVPLAADPAAEAAIIAREDIRNEDIIKYYMDLTGAGRKTDEPRSGLGLESGTVDDPDSGVAWSEASPMPEPVVVSEPMPNYGFTEPPVTWVDAPSMAIATIRALRVQDWLRKEIIKIENELRASHGFDGRGAVVQLQTDIENFLVGSEAPKYLKFRRRVLEHKIDELVRIAQLVNMQNRHQSLFVEIPMDSDFNYEYVPRGKVGEIMLAFHEMWREDIDFGSILMNSQFLEYEDIERMEVDREETKRKLSRAMSAFTDAHGVLFRKCEFFQRSLFGKYKSVRRACQKAEDSFEMSAEITEELMYTSFGYYNAFMLNMMHEGRPNFKSDFIESIDWALNRDFEILKNK